MGRLGSFVFFDRDVAERSEPSGMIRTIAYHLACHREDIADSIRHCAKRGSRTGELDLDVQFQQLLVEPLARVTVEERVIIIDALDEGGDGRFQAAFLKLLSRLPQLPDFVRILITSRRLPPIQLAFQKVSNLRVMDLNKEPDINDDIYIYISAQMDEIHSQNSDLPLGWPGTDVVNSLVQHAHGLFVWAAVACSYIKEYAPAARIQTLLSKAFRAQAEHSLNSLYAVAIRDSVPWDSDDFAQKMHDVLSIIIVSQNPQSSKTVCEILEIDNSLASKLISRLQSILATGENGLVHLVHPSVRDYLVDPKRCDPGLPWSVNEGKER
ncbi:hypothetical protein K438DRAFT_2063924 [Mycena galopus ATCC 62051]|nr:hypothetical protein K438DRAFT_2063924 [Mycena galopus ATCC 62051]